MKLHKLTGMALIGILASAISVCAIAKTISYAEHGALKMLYDNRMYPQAVEHNGTIYLVWRGEKGMPYIRTYMPATGTFSDPVMLLEGRTANINAKRYASDHHYSPVVWLDNQAYIHILIGCHNNAGIHLVSEKPEDITRWRQGTVISKIMSYPKIQRIYDNKTLVYFRYTGHLGFWTYKISADNGKTWTGPAVPPVDLNSEPQDGYKAADAGSYHTIRVSQDGRTLHVGFIWKVENPVPNTRYHRTLGDHTQRYNLYYIKIDLPTGKVYNYDGKEMKTPINKREADRDCIVWDTDERVAAVGPSICLDKNDEPYFVLPVSDETPYRCWFYFVRHVGGGWKHTAIARTSHPFNSCYLTRKNGRFHAYLITSDGENVLDDESEKNMDSYGWGDRVEEWAADTTGDKWTLTADLSPVKGMKYQNVQPVWQDMKSTRTDMILFYGWRDTNGPGTAFMVKTP